MTPHIEIDLHNLAAAANALAALPEAVQQAADRARAQAADVLGPSIARETPVRTGFLQSSERVFVEGSYALMFEATAPYASFVAYGTSRQRANPFIERGVSDVETQVEGLYEAAFQELAEGFDRGL